MRRVPRRGDGGPFAHGSPRTASSRHRCQPAERTGPLLHCVEEDEQVPRPLVQDSVEVAPVATAQLPELPVDLRTVRERKRRVVVGDPVQQADLEVDLLLPLRRESVHEVVDGLPAVLVTVVNGLHSVRGPRSGKTHTRRGGAARATSSRVGVPRRAGHRPRETVPPTTTRDGCLRKALPPSAAGGRVVRRRAKACQSVR